MMFLEWLREDIPYWDLTSEAIVDNRSWGRAVVKANTRLYSGCIGVIADLLDRLGFHVREAVEDRVWVEKGSNLIVFEGRVKDILYIERTLLNLMAYMLGVSTTTRLFLERARSINPRIRVAATRKTPPGLRLVAKLAVECGGGDTHRLCLSDAYLIKDNHIVVAGDVVEAIRRVREKASFVHRIEVEVEGVDDGIRAVREGVDIVMLDNMDPGSIREFIRELERLGLRDRVVVEASGGINLENIVEYAGTGVDVISSSVITMNPVKIDISLDIVGVECR